VAENIIGRLIIGRPVAGSRVDSYLGKLRRFGPIGVPTSATLQRCERRLRAITSMGLSFLNSICCGLRRAIPQEDDWDLPQFIGLKSHAHSVPADDDWKNRKAAAISARSCGFALRLDV